MAVLRLLLRRRGNAPQSTADQPNANTKSVAPATTPWHGGLGM